MGSMMTLNGDASKIGALLRGETGPINPSPVMQPTKSPTCGTVCCSQFFNVVNLILFVRRVNQIAKLATVSFCLIYHYNALLCTECAQVMMNVAIHQLVMADSACITLKCF